jgi:DNA polymerase III delta subunit
MIELIHGDDIVSSRNYFISKKNEYQDATSYDGSELLLDALFQILQSDSLFSNSKDIFLENFLSSKKDSANLVKDLFMFLKDKKQVNLFLWEATEQSKTLISLFDRNSVKTFKTPSIIFVFLDNIKPGNTNSVSFFHNVLKNTNEDFVFAMIIRQFRLLLAISYPPERNIDEVKRLNPWQREKLINQARYFKLEELKKNYEKLYEIDFAYKSGQLTFSLLQAIDIFLLDL